MKTCWYKTAVDGAWEIGFFHEWGQNYEEFETGPGPFPAAIIEDATDSRVHVVYAGWVSFNPDKPDAPEGVQVVPKSRRFEPRLVEAAEGTWLVQVHPETIEVFSGGYICQVRLVDGIMNYTQGGLPLVAIREMFEEALA